VFVAEVNSRPGDGYVAVRVTGDVDTGTRAELTDALERALATGSPFVLVDLTGVTSTNRASHLAAIKGMREVPYKRISVYGPKHLQVLINTLSAIARKSLDVRAFPCRYDAVRWLWKAEKDAS
jgi:hypothetical protein